MRANAVIKMLAAGVVVMGASATAAAPAAVAALRMVPLSTGNVLVSAHPAQPSTTAQCESGAVVPGVDFACYQPFQVRDAYHLGQLYTKGINGRGETIVIVDAFGSPTIREDLATFDKAFGLPAPPSFRIIQPVGPVPPCTADPYGVGDCEGWGTETSLDVEWSHVIAPNANIVLVESPSSETEGVNGFPDIIAAENYVINHHLGDVISQSFAATEQTFVAPPAAYGLRSAYINAAKHDVTVLGSSGDDGDTGSYCSPSNRDCASFPCCYSFANTEWPASDPLVTGLGGTQLHLSDSGKTISPASVWNDPLSLFYPGTPGTLGASGGGHSTFFSRPAFQNGVASVVGDSRGTPDISMSAAVNGGVDFYQSAPAGGGWGVVGGTSEASPEFAGIVALADQVAGHSLGDLNPRLYALAEAGGDNGIVPISSGNNTYSFVNTKGKVVTVHGFAANGSYNDATGWGTIDAAQFVPALAGS
jgi:subtilase family serine protease